MQEILESPVTGEEFGAALERHLEWVREYFETVHERPVLPSVSPGDVAKQLPAYGPEHGESLDAILADFDSKIAPALTLWNHPRFFAYYPSACTPPSFAADMLMSALNVNVMLWKTSPAATELEQTTLNWLREWLKLPEQFFGIIYDTASTGVLHAMAAAREKADPDVRANGMRNDLIVYISEQTHSSSEKAALTLGFGQKNIRKIGVDDKFQMRADLLREAVDADIAAGKKPCCIVASVGSTSTSAIDPVAEIADVAEACGAWLHVDAAYAGSAAILPEMRHTIAGSERADSFILNPHKWLYVSVDCSVLYTRHPDILRRAFALTPEYLRTSADNEAVNYMEYGVQLGRRFRALKLWYVFRYYGREGIQKMLRTAIQNARLLQSLIEADADFELAAPVPFSLVCFRHRSTNEFNTQLLAEVNATGNAFLSHTVLNGKYVLRCAVGNWQTTEEDIRETWRLIRETARRLR